MFQGSRGLKPPKVSSVKINFECSFNDRRQTLLEFVAAHRNEAIYCKRDDQVYAGPKPANNFGVSKRFSKSRQDAATRLLTFYRIKQDEEPCTLPQPPEVWINAYLSYQKSTKISQTSTGINIHRYLRRALDHEIDGDYPQVAVIKAVDVRHDEVVICRQLMKAAENDPSLRRRLLIPFHISPSGQWQCLAMESCAQGDGESFLKDIESARQQGLIGHRKAWDAERWMLREMLEALAAVHALELAHLDIKPGNCFLTRNPDGEGIVLKLGDWGTTRPRGELLTSDQVDCIRYLSPERLKNKAELLAHKKDKEWPSLHAIRARSRADIWAVGVTLYEMLHGAPPWENLTFGTDDEVKKALMSMEPLELDQLQFDNLPTTLKDAPGMSRQVINEFQRACMADRPSDRWTAGQLLQSPLFHGMDEDAIQKTLKIIAHAD